MPVDAIVAGHICLDIIPQLHGSVSFDPGKLVETGPVTLSTGGAVSNTGLALHKLGVSVRLVGKVADDLFGRAVREIVNRHGEGLGDAMASAPAGEFTSYTVVLSPEGRDRTFLHAPGCNHTFGADDVPDDALAGARLLHFGYPPLMARMFADGGEELERLLRRARAAGLVTSLDMALPDPGSPAGQADWKPILRRVLPHVDLFLPSAPELLFMLDRAAFDRPSAAEVPKALLPGLAGEVLAMGAKVVGLKNGECGLYVRGGDDFRPGWDRAEVWAPCFEVDVAGTTGAGDATIAGFLMGFLHGMGPEAAAEAAVAVGACCCEAPDALSGVRSWDETCQRIADGWRRR